MWKMKILVTFIKADLSNDGLLWEWYTRLGWRCISSFWSFLLVIILLCNSDSCRWIVEVLEKQTFRHDTTLILRILQKKQEFTKINKYRQTNVLTYSLAVAIGQRRMLEMIRLLSKTDLKVLCAHKHVKGKIANKFQQRNQRI